MIKGLSTHIFVNQRLTLSMLERIEQAGVEVVELFCALQHFDYRDSTQVREVANWFRSSKLKLNSIHAPMYRDTVWGRSGPHAVISIAETDKSRRVEACDEIKRALEISDYAPFKYMVTHFGVSREEWDERKMEAAFSSIEHLRMFARQRGADLVLENIPNELSTPSRLVEFLRYTHMNDMGLCFDIGHAHIGGGVAASFETMRDHVRATHVHDNGGLKDDHLFPFEGTIDWKHAMAELFSYQKKNGYPIVLEIHDNADTVRPLAHVAEVFRKFEEMESIPAHA